ncbi:MAG: glycoside hydrolase [Candidatus Omnitrophica bacterium]|nr:glycoside hydrolase [Candidatus Omnitrophota bacterium]MBU1997732.1 glycoside hydrolase [Candidatus Omnitrophota bacterium]MBU4334303.1 glycoside hydrolase [Candidatus Omnitrophota bacterium]
MLKFLIKKIQRKGQKTYRRKIGKIRFDIYAPQASNVELVGCFNSWMPGQHIMKKERDGFWKTYVMLCSGKYEYKFIVDNKWEIDPENSKTVIMDNGTINSVKKVDI